MESVMLQSLFNIMLLIVCLHAWRLVPSEPGPQGGHLSWDKGNGGEKAFGKGPTFSAFDFKICGRLIGETFVDQFWLEQLRFGFSFYLGLKES